MIKIAVPGVSGRMGMAVAEQVLQAQDLNLAVATVRANNPMLGKKLLTSNLQIASSFADTKIDVLIDFTLPAGVMQHLEYCLQNKVAMVIGATGFNEQQLNTIKQAATQIPIVKSSNMSIGVNICYKLLATAAKMFDSNWDISIVDVHHKHKKDSPSGTAKEMAQVLATSSGKLLDEINIYSERQGETIGEHTVTFASPEEIVMIGHVAESRNIYATGALTAARWINGRGPGLYTMQDVI